MTTPASAPGRAATTAIVTATAVAGGIALLAVGVSAAAGALAPTAVEVYEYGVGSGIDDFIPGEAVGGDGYYDIYEPYLEDLEGIRVEAAATSFTLDFGAVEEAALTVENSPLAAPWSMYRDDDELVIEHPDFTQGGQTSGCLFGCSPTAGSGSVTLTLPQHLAESGLLNADISISGGELRGEGEFADLALEVNAGSLHFAGAARSLDLGVSVGEARVELADVGEVELDVQTGDATVTLTGDAPRSVDATAKMGGLTVQLPEEEYRVDLRGALGEVDSRLAENEESEHAVRVQATAAEVILR